MTGRLWRAHTRERSASYREFLTEKAKIFYIHTATPFPSAISIASPFESISRALSQEKTASPMKPAPDAIRYLLDEFQLDPAETIMIGDREIDILSGKNAGIHTCLFTDGNPGAAASEAEYTAGNMAELYALFLG